jgi:HTH-type transcriptional regulator/antitoxin HigA
VVDRLRAIRNDDDLAWALAEVSHDFDNLPDPLSDDRMRFDIPSDLIEAYEDKHYAIKCARTDGACKAHMVASRADRLTNGATQRDLIQLTG